MSAPEEELLAERRIARVLAPNPGPITLEGTNSWVVGGSPAWVVDPGRRAPSTSNACRPRWMTAGVSAGWS